MDSKQDLQDRQDHKTKPGILCRSESHLFWRFDTEQLETLLQHVSGQFA